MPEEPKLFENEIRLYITLVDQIHKYNAVFWQAPTALIAANFFTLDKFIGNPLPLLFLSIFDAIMIFAFRRMVIRQSEIVTASKDAETALRETYPRYVPTFEPLKPSAPFLTVWTLSVLDLVLFIYSIVETIKHLCCA